MKILSALSLAVLFTVGNCGKQSHQSNGLKVYLHPDLQRYAPFSHVCKMSDGEYYFAVLGTKTGTVFVDYTDDKLEEGDIKFFPGATSKWRECRSYTNKNGNTYAYVVTEGPDFSQYPGGIQIFKINGGLIELVNTYIGNFNSAHTIFIDTIKGLAFVNGSRWQGDILEHHQDHKDHLGGLRILDIATDPENPRDLGGYGGSYTHDSYALGKVDIPPGFKFNPVTREYVETEARSGYILYLADIFEGYIRILDVTDLEKPVLVNSVRTPLYNQGISVHNVWSSEDKKWLFATEETKGSSLLVYDISNPVNPRFVTAYRSDKVADGSVIHNVVIKGNIAFCSWYTEGVRLIDISNPVHPKEFAFFDSSAKSFTDGVPFHGNWSVDVDDRGLIMISDIEEGLFILRSTK